MRIHLFLATAAIALLLGLLAMPSTPVRAQPVPVPVPVAPADPVESGSKTIRLPLGPGEVSLDPHRCPSGTSLRLIGDLYEGLTQWLPGETPTLAPCLAKDWPTVSADGLTYTFKLRTEARFHNSICFEGSKGRALKSSDVVASFKRMAATSSEETNWFWLIKGLIAGLDEYAEKAAASGGFAGSDDTEIEGLSAPDDETFVMKLTRPFGPIMAVLAHPACSIIAAEAMNYYSSELERRAVGTAPFRLNAVLAGRLYVLKRIEDYWGEKPDFERVTYGEPGSIEDFMSGEWAHFDLNQTLYRRYVRDGKLVGQLAKCKAEFNAFDDLGTYFTAFNMSDPIFGALDADGRGLRKAIAFCIDRTRMVEGWFGSTSFGRPANELFPPGCEFYELGKSDDWGSYDLKQAKAALDATKYKGGLDPATGAALTVTLYGNAGAGNERMRDVIKAGLGQLGINLEAKLLAPDLLTAAMDSGEGQMYLSGWFLDYPDAQNILQLYDSRNIGTGEENRNVARYESKEFDEGYAELLKLALKPENLARRREITGKLAARLLEDRPIVPLMVQRHASVRSNTVTWPKVPQSSFDETRFIKSK